jgi:hypothetical protein
MIGIRKGNVHFFSPTTCSHDDCIQPRLKGRKLCFDHAIAEEDREDKEREALLREAGVEEVILTGKDVWLYFIGLEGDDSIVKIGRTNGDVMLRLNALQVGNHRTLYILAKVIAPLDAEYVVHRAFKLNLVKGEWFKRDDRLNSFIEVAKRENWKTLAQLLKMYEQ